MLDARRYRAAAGHLRELLAREEGVRFRAAPPPAHLRRAVPEPADGALGPGRRSRGRSAGCWRCPPRSASATSPCRASPLAERLRAPARAAARGRFSFDEAVAGADRMTVAITAVRAAGALQARRGGTGSQSECFGEIARPRARRSRSAAAAAGRRRGERRRGRLRVRRCRGGCPGRLERTRWDSRRRRGSSPRACAGAPGARADGRGAAVPRGRPARRARAGRRHTGRRAARRRRAGAARRAVRARAPRHHAARTGRGLHARQRPPAEEAARRLFSRPRAATLTPAQAETLAIVAYLQPISRPEITRIRGVSADSATSTLLERGLIEEAGRSQFGAVLYRTGDPVPQAVRPALAG